MSSVQWSPLGGGSGGGAVDSVNSLTGALTIAAGSGISISSIGTTITVTNTAGGLSVGTFGSTPNAAGLSLAAGVLTMQPADGTNPGGVSTGAQTFAGNKTFSGTIAASNLSGTNTGDVTIGTASGLSLVGQALSLGLASAGVTGALSGTDWSTFNSKQAAGSYITALTGDVTAAGPGSVAATVALVGGASAANVATATALVNTAQSGRKFLASPDDGSSGAPAFRAIVVADVPTLNQNTTGTASNITASSNATLTTLSVLSLPFSQVTGTVSLSQGGTGQTTKAPAFDALSPMTAGGDLIYGGASGTGTRLANGTAGQVLTSAGGTAAPTWTTKEPVGFTARNYSNGTLSSGSSHTVVFDTVARDDASAYNSSTGEYTVPFTGWCIVESQIGMAAAAAAATRQLFSYIRVNGTGISNAYTYAYITNTITHRVYNSIQWYCTAGDVITIVAENDLGATGTPQSGTGNGHFSVMMFE